LDDIGLGRWWGVYVGCRGGIWLGKVDVKGVLTVVLRRSIDGMLDIGGEVCVPFGVLLTFSD
jgi:hypothetical protein